MAPEYTAEERDLLKTIVTFIESQAARFREAAGLLRGVTLNRPARRTTIRQAISRKPSEP